MRNKRDKRIDGIFDYLIFHDLKEQEGYKLLSKQIWFKELFDQEQIQEIKKAFLETLVPKCIKVFAYPQYSAKLMRCCREYFPLAPFSPSLMEGLLHLTADPKEIEKLCTRIIQIYSETPYYGSTGQVKIAKLLENLVDEIQERIRKNSNYEICLPGAAQKDQDFKSILACKHVMPEVYNLFRDDENTYARGQIRDKTTQEILSEFIFCLPTGNSGSEENTPQLSWVVQLTLLLQIWLDAEDLVNLPKLKDHSELLQLLIRYQTETESGMLFIDEGDDEDEPLYSLENRIALAEEIEKLGLEDMFDIGLEEFNSDDCLITVYSSACTAFNLIGTNV